MHARMTSPGNNGGNGGGTGFMAGEWQVWPQRNVILRGEEQVRVEPRVMDVLVHLAERAGQVVSKEELVDRVWEGRYVTDEVLTVTVYALRKALGDDARRPRYIETVSRRGYRWIAPVARPGEPAPAMAIAPGSMESPVSAATAPRRFSPAAWAGATVALAVVAASATWMRLPGPGARHTPSPEAHEAYVKGRFFLDQRSVQGWRSALEHFERAVKLDPLDPAAHAGLADTYSAMSDFGVASPAEMRPRAMQAARRALELEAESAEGHAALGRVQFLFDWDFGGAERSLGRAVALDGDYMPAHQSLGWLRSAQGRPGEAAAAARRALQLDPVNTARYTELAWVLALGGGYDEALAQVDRALGLSPRATQIQVTRGWICEMAGRPDGAFAAYSEAARLAGAPEEALRRMEATYRAGGLTGYYRDWLDQQQRGGHLPLSDTWRAHLYVRAGQLERAIESLELAYRKREGALAWVNVEPAFAPLRSDARFQLIASRVGK